MASTSRRTSAKLHLLTTKQVQHAAEGDHSDGVGLLLRVRGEPCSWVLRYTSPTGRRREMGLGVCRRCSPAQAGDSLTGARDTAHKSRELLRQGLDPIDQRDQQRETGRQVEDTKRAEKARERWTLARCTSMAPVSWVACVVLPVTLMLLCLPASPVRSALPGA